MGAGLTLIQHKENCNKKSKMQYMKTCGICNQKRNGVATENCTEAEKENPEKSKPCTLGKDKSHCEAHGCGKSSSISATEVKEINLFGVEFLSFIGIEKE